MQTDIDATSFVRAGMTELELLHDSGDTTTYTQAAQRYIAAQDTIIYLQIRGDALLENRQAMDGIFPTALLKYKGASGDVGASGVLSEAWFDNRDYAVKNAAFSIGILVIAIGLLTAGNLFIIHDATQMVITPMERVLSILKQLAPDMAHHRDKDKDRKDKERRRSDRHSRTVSESDDLTTSSSGMDDDDEDGKLI